MEGGSDQPFSIVHKNLVAPKLGALDFLSLNN